MDGPFPSGLLGCIEQFFATEHLRQPGQDAYDGVFDTDLFFPLQRKRELARMMQSARTIQPETVMEVGSDKGGSLYHWVKSLPTVKRVIACEVRGTPYARLFERAFPAIDFLWLPHSSYKLSTVKQVREWLGADKIDCLFIDGDKSYFDRDFDAYRPLLFDRGIAFFHDITDPAPGAAYRRVCERGYRHEEIVDRQDSFDAHERFLADVPSASPYEDWLRHWQGRSCGVGVIYLEAGLR